MYIGTRLDFLEKYCVDIVQWSEAIPPGLIFRELRCWLYIVLHYIDGY